MGCRIRSARRRLDGVLSPDIGDAEFYQGPRGGRGTWLRLRSSVERAERRVQTVEGETCGHDYLGQCSVGFFPYGSIASSDTPDIAGPEALN